MLQTLLPIFAPNSTQQRSTGKNYLLALLWTILSIMVRLGFDPYLGSTQAYLFPLFAVVVAAWLGGFGPALLALSIGLVGSLYFVAYPRASFQISGLTNQLEIVVLGLLGITTAAIGATQHRARARVNLLLLESQQHLVQLQNEVIHRSRAEQSLRSQTRKLAKAEKSFRELAHSLPQQVWTCDNAGNRRTLGPQWSTYTGQPDTDHDGLVWRDVVHPDDLSVLERNWNEAVSQGQNYEAEIRIRGADGTYHWFQSKAEPAYDEDGNIIRWYGTSNDIHIRKILEEEYDRLISVLDSTPDFFGIFTIDGRLLKINSAGKTLIGSWDNHSLGGLNLETIHSQESVTLLKEVGIPYALEHSLWQGETELLCLDGSKLPLSQIIVAHKDSTGQVEYLSTIARDISEIRETRARLRESNIFLEAILDALSSQLTVINNQGIILMNNATWKKSHGLSDTGNSDGGIGQPYHEFIDPHIVSLEAGAPVKSIIQECIKNHYSRKQTTYKQTVGKVNEWYQMTVDRFTSHDTEYYVIANLRITQQIQAEDEARYNSDLLDACQQPIISLNRDRTILTWNQGATMLYGYTSDNAIGKTIDELLKTKCRVDTQTIQSELRNSKRWYGELEQTTRSGECRDVVSLRQIIQRSDGTEVVLESNHDITDRKAISRTLAQSEQRYRQLANVLPHMIWTADIHGNFEFANDQWAHALGSELTLNGVEPWQTIIHPDDASTTRHAWYTSLQTGLPLEVECRFRNHTTSEYQWYLGRALPTRNDEDIITSWVGAWTNIDDSKRLQNELAQSLLRFQQLSESVPVIVFTADVKGEMDYFNQPWTSYTGRSLILSRGNSWQEQIHPDDRNRTVRIWTKCIQSGSTYEEDIRLLSHDNQYLWHLMRGIPIHDSNGRIIQWAGIITNIEGQRQYQDELEKIVEARTEELSRSNEELEKFAYVASHDLQEPLRKIQAFGDRLHHKCSRQLDELGLDYLQRILTSAARMRTLINGLLTLSRITTRELTFQSVALDAVIADVLDDLDHAVHDSNALITVGEQLPQLEADVMQLRQLFQNILSNAIKFRDSARPLEIAIRSDWVADVVEKRDAQQYALFCRVSISDNGIGFDEQYRDKIFEVFQRLHGRGKYEGTGIGLAICRKIVDRHRGKLEVTSQEGKGTTFHIHLPLLQLQPEPFNEKDSWKSAEPPY